MAASTSSSANGTGLDPFAEYYLLETAVRNLLVHSLKSLLKELNQSSHSSRTYLKVSGNKPELANRVINVLAEKKNSGDVRGFQAIKDMILRNGGHLPTSYRPPSSSYPSAQALGGIPANKFNSVTAPAYRPAAASTSIPTRPMPSSSAGARINFLPSPFYEIKQFVSSVVTTPEAPTSSDRKNGIVHVTFTPEQVALLQQSTPTIEARLFCTTQEAYAASLSGRNPATIEFPLTCEARVNGVQLSINLRGNKKHTGRIPPPNLNKDKALVLQSSRPNRIELTYTNAPKRHAMVVALCQITKAETLVEKLQKSQFRSKDAVLKSMKKAAEDDDIEAGAATMSLKCPLSYMRMTIPARSTHCPHVQCFDALSFFSMNEQTPSWMCPVCNQTLKPDDLIMDGYVDDILKKVSEEHESVVVEPDGAWRTQDGKITSDGTLSNLASNAAALSNALDSDSDDEEEEEEDVKPKEGARLSGAGSPADIVILDSPTPPPTGPPSTKAAPTPATYPSSVASASAARTADKSRQSSSRPALETVVIDLTLDSDDEDAPPPRSTVAARSSVVQRPATNGTMGSNGAGSNRPRAASPNLFPNEDRTPEDEQVRRPGKRARVEPSSNDSDSHRGAANEGGGPFSRPLQRGTSSSNGNGRSSVPGLGGGPKANDAPARRLSDRGPAAYHDSEPDLARSASYGGSSARVGGSSPEARRWSASCHRNGWRDSFEDDEDPLALRNNDHDIYVDEDEWW